jgi:hypothetical protein
MHNRAADEHPETRLEASRSFLGRMYGPVLSKGNDHHAISALNSVRNGAEILEKRLIPASESAKLHILRAV